MKKTIILPLVFTFFLTVSWTPAAQAAIIGTESLLVSQQQSLQNRVQSALIRDDVREQLIKFGVNPHDAEQRIASLTEEELLQIQTGLQELPAAGGVIEVIGIVFLVLLILELVGVTDIFKKI